MTDGRHDFDFFHGRWHGMIRKLADTSDRGCTEWVELEATCECAPILGGLGNFETSEMRPGADSPDGDSETGPSRPGPVEGATLRMFEPSTGLWRIWWMSTRQPGVLDPPVLGRFDGDRGVFEGPDAFGDTPILVRYEWDRLTPDRVRWAQRFSWDDGATWDGLNFVTMWSRTPGQGRR
jgi:hypothetical protein